MENSAARKLLDRVTSKGAFWPILLGLAGLLLLIVPPLWPNGEKKAGNTLPSAADSSAADEYDYAEEIENRLTMLISRIKGAGRVRVMVSVESGVEQVYAEDSKTSQSENIDREGGEITSSDKQKTNESQAVIIDGGSGSAPLKKKEIYPAVSGVAVVCTGGADPIVASRILEAVTTVLGIGSNRVCVLPGN